MYQKLYQNALIYFKEKDFFNNSPDDKKTEEYLKKVLTIEKDRLVKFLDVGEGNEFFFQDVSYDKELLRWKKNTDEEIRKVLQNGRRQAESIGKEKRRSDRCSGRK